MVAGTTTPLLGPQAAADPHLAPLSPDRRKERTDSGSSFYHLQSLIEKGNTVLNRGLGAFNVQSRSSLTSNARSSLFSKSGILLIMAVLFTAPLICYIDIHFETDDGQGIITEDPKQLSSAFARLAGLPPTCAFVNYLIAHIRRTTFWWEPKTLNSSCWTCCCPIDPVAFWPMVLVSLGLLRTTASMLLVKRLADQAVWYMTMMISMILLGAYYRFLDKIDDLIQAMREEQEMINKTKTVSKMQTLVKTITRTGKAEKDAAYCFEETNTVPAQVLSYVWWPYYFVGKILGAAVVMSMFMGVNAQVISHLLYSGLLLSAASLGGAMFELGPSALSLLRLSLHKPFYVGDLVTLNTNGAMDAPTSIMGFVENITMMYVVVRNFEMKQTWIPHRHFSNMIIQNWTRRPTKTVKLEIGISCRCPVKKVEQLRRFSQQWIEKSPEIQQKNYRKFHITKTGNGYNIEIIFFPGIGVSHRGIRQKFLLAFMAFAEELQVPFVPLNIMQNFCDETAVAPTPIEGGWFLEDSAFEKHMPDPEDMLPKGVGLGFKEFPPAEDENAVEVVEVNQQNGGSGGRSGSGGSGGSVEDLERTLSSRRAQWRGMQTTVGMARGES